MRKEIKKFTEEQEDIIEKTFKRVSSNSLRAKFLIDLVKESLINIHGEFNQNVSAEHISEILTLTKDLLDPVDELVSELSMSGGYLLWESNLESIENIKANNKPHQA